MSPEVKKGLKEAIACAIFGVILGSLLGYSCGREIDREFAENCDSCDEEMTGFCHEYWEAKELCGYPKKDTE